MAKLIKVSFLENGENTFTNLERCQYAKEVTLLLKQKMEKGELKGDKGALQRKSGDRVMKILWEVEDNDVKVVI